jgi:hypothetical protein
MIIPRIFAAFYKNPPSDITAVHTVHKERFFGKNATSQFLKITFVTMLQ